MAEHTFEETVQLAVKLAIIKQHPIGSLYLTMGNEDPSTFIGGGWKRIKKLILQASDDDHPAGTEIEAGLPNATGSIGGVLMYGSNNTAGGSGAFSWKKENQVGFNGEFQGTHIWSTVAVDLSKGNSIYGKSDTVQPHTITANIWQRIS